MKQLYIWVLLFGVLTVRSCPANSIDIVQRGKSTFTIVVPQHAPQSLLQTAQELQYDIHESTGAQLPLQMDAVKISKPYISLGETRQLKSAGINTKGIALEGFCIISKDGNIYILGKDTPDGQHTNTGGVSNGTANGVYTFLEDYLNVRWLMPGDLGRDVPTKSTFTVESINRIEAPLFFSRRIPFIQNMENDRYPAVHQWEDRQKLGYSVNIIQRANWRKTVPPEMFSTHPDWFPLIGGKRTLDSKNYKLETTNPDLVKYFSQQAIAALKTNSAQYTFSLSPSDYPGGWSESPESKALYDKPQWGYQMVTTLMLKFYHDVSQIVAQEYPQGRLAGYIYDVYKLPPTNAQAENYLPLPTNFYPVLANNSDYGYKLYQPRNRQSLEQLVTFWSKQSSQLTYYGIPNRLNVTSGIILPPAPGILNYLFPQLIKYKVKGVLLYGATSWSEAAMGNYIIAKMMWNPHLDANELQREWLNRAYGEKAGATMEQLYIKLDDWFNQYYQTNPAGYLYHLSDDLLKVVYANHYPEIEQLSLQAKKEVKNPQQKARFQMLEDNLILLQSTLRNKKMLPADFTSPLQRDDAQIKQLLQKPSTDFKLFPGKVD